jgi:hypothetical protein
MNGLYVSLKGNSSAKLFCAFWMLQVFMPANAEVVSITAEFVPNGTQLTNSFEVTTPSAPSSICILCGSGSRNYLATRIGYTPPGGLLPASAGLSFKVMGEKRKVALTHETGAYTENLYVSLVSMGGRLPQSRSSSSYTGGSAYWGQSSFIAPPDNCSGHPGRFGGIGEGGVSFFLWYFQSSSPCGRINSVAIPGFQVTNTYYRYELELPKPLAMKPGVYRGRIDYTVGVGGASDIQFISGAGGTVSDDVLSINVELTVGTIFKVELPTGGNKIELAPEEGWQRWLQAARKPTRLVRNQTFDVWSNSKFSMRLECAVRVGNGCGLRKIDGAPHVVPLQVSVSLPNNYTDSGNRRVTDKVLGVDGVGEVMIPETYTERLPANLKFEVGSEAVSEMLQYPGSSYGGTVTVVWETHI